MGLSGQTLQNFNMLRKGRATATTPESFPQSIQVPSSTHRGTIDGGGSEGSYRELYGNSLNIDFVVFACGTN